MSVRRTTQDNPVYVPRTADHAARAATPAPGARPAAQSRSTRTTADRYVGASGAACPAGPATLTSTGSAQGDKAAQSVKVLLDQGATKAAAQALEKALVNLAPNVAAKVYEVLKASIGPALSRIEGLNKKDTEATVTALAHAAKLAGPDAVADLARQLASYIPNGKVGDWDDGIAAAIKAGAGPELAVALVEQLEAAGKPQGARDISNALVAGVDRLRESAKSAIDKKAELETRIAQDMATFGASMTADQRAAYEAGFWNMPEHATVRDDAVRIASDLSHALEVAGPQLEALARAGGENAGEVLLDSYEVLAKVPEHAEQALLWGGRIGNDPQLFKSIDGFIHDDLEKRLSDGLVADGTAAFQQQLIQRFADDPSGQQKLLSEARRVFADYKNAKAYVSLGKEVASFLDNTERFANGSAQHATKLLEGWDTRSKLGKAFAVFGVASGIFRTGKALSDGEYLDAVKSALGTSKAGLELAAGVMGAYAGAAKLAGTAEFIGKFAPGIGMVLDAIQFGKDINELRNDPNAGEVVKAIGTFLQLGGDVAGYVPVLGTAVDGLLTIAGSVIHLVGDFIDGVIEGNDARDKLRAEQAELLRKATGCSKDLASELVATPASTYKRLVDLGFTPSQVRALASDSRVKLGSKEAVTALTTAALFGLTASETATFVKMACAGGKIGPYGTPLTTMYGVLFNPVTETSPADLLWQKHDLSQVQAYMLDLLGDRSPELAKWLRANQGTANWDVVNFPHYMAEI